MDFLQGTETFCESINNPHRTGSTTEAGLPLITTKRDGLCRPAGSLSCSTCAVGGISNPTGTWMKRPGFQRSSLRRTPLRPWKRPQGEAGRGAPGTRASRMYSDSSTILHLYYYSMFAICFPHWKIYMNQVWQSRFSWLIQGGHHFRNRIKLAHLEPKIEAKPEFRTEGWGSWRPLLIFSVQEKNNNSKQIISGKTDTLFHR